MAQPQEPEPESKSMDVDDDRMCKEVIAPPRHPLATDILFDKSKPGGINLTALTAHLNAEGRLSMEDALRLVSGAQALYAKEPNLLRLNDPITVCGDIHGQFFDLLRLLEAGGDPSSTQYLFLGDYVDRGCFATEVVLLMFAHKMVYPTSWFMIRGNHECRHLTAFFNFKDECLYKYGLEFYDAVMNCFDRLPIAATINNKFLCCHGGLSPDISTLHDIAELDRFREVPREGPFCDLLWADPVDEDKTNDDDADEDEDGSGGNEDELEQTTWFSYNETRQCSYVFGIDAVRTFLKKNNLTAIIRAHEAQFDGYKMQMINEQTQIPRVITIFSAPNYCDVYKNKGACLKFNDELLNIRQFVSSPHPYYLPNFMDVFTWSLPFVAEKVTDMLYSIVSYEGAKVEADATVQVTDATAQSVKKGNVLKGKVVAVTKLMRMYKVLKENQDNIVRLKQLSPSGTLPSGVLAGGSKSIERAISSFKGALQADKVNEAVPGAGKGRPRHDSKQQRHYKNLDGKEEVTQDGNEKDAETKVKVQVTVDK